MNLYNREIDPKKLPFDLRDCREKIGLIKSAVMKCPGVYFAHMFATIEHYTGLDFYIVMDNAPISAEARTYGQKLPAHPELLLYQYEGEDYGYKVIEYEILKFCVKNDLPCTEYGDIHSFALFGMEVCPSYFGAFPAPTVTPWGYTTRYKSIHPGVFWIETEQCKTTLAVSYVMRDDISEEVFSMAHVTPFDQEHGLDETMGYFFFQEKDICLIVFELMCYEENMKWDMIDTAALMNAVWANHPEYAANYNLREQYGENDYMGMIFRQFDPTHELNSSEEKMIKITPEVSKEFFGFEKDR